MKKLISSVVISIVMVSYAHAYTDKEKIENCEKILTAGMFNDLLENLCGFNGQLQDKLMQVYDAAQCRSIIPQAEFDTKFDATIDAVAEDARMRISAYGNDVYCEMNIKRYVDLKNILNKQM